jgi:hypothetical protein
VILETSGLHTITVAQSFFGANSVGRNLRFSLQGREASDPPEGYASTHVNIQVVKIVTFSLKWAQKALK